MRLAAFSFDLVNKRNLVSMAAALLLCLSFNLHSDTLDLAQPESKASMPAQGLKMADVKAQYGAAVKENPPVGKPAIIRWDYDNYTVYFENEYVIHSVAHKRNPKSSDNKHAASIKPSDKPGTPPTPASESAASQSSSTETATEEPSTAAVTAPENPIVETTKVETVAAETVETAVEESAAIETSGEQAPVTEAPVSEVTAIVENVSVEVSAEEDSTPEASPVESSTSEVTPSTATTEASTEGSPETNTESSSAPETTDAAEPTTEEAPTKKARPHSRR